MRDFSRWIMKRLKVGWFWTLVVLALPNCTFHAPVVSDRTTAVFCDIEQPVFGRSCASATEKAVGIRLAAAAVALNAGQTSVVGLDESPEARARCGGEPEAVRFQGAYPEGYTTCLEEPIAPPSEACITQCEHFFGQVQPDGTLIPEDPPSPVVVAFCQQRAHPSTNLPVTGFPDACTSNGILRADFVDPRRTPEPVEWDPASLIRVTATGNTLTRSDPTSPPANNPPLDAGAASIQVITRGDGYVEFSAPNTNLTQVGGLAMFLGGPDTEPSLTDLSFAIALNHDGRYYVIESGTIIPGPDVNNSFGLYTAGEHFRVNVQDHSDGTAGITYSRLTGSCAPGSPCPEVVFFTHTGSTVNYPLRVDASFREQGSTLANVMLVRIQ